MVYSLIYLVNGRTPWACEGKANSSRMMRKFKKNYSAREMCSSFAAPLTSILDTIYNLKYSEKPDYDYIQKLFIDELLKLDFAPQVNNYDWVRNPCFLKPG